MTPVSTPRLAAQYLLFLIGLNLSGFFEFTGRFANIGSSLTAKAGYGGSFFTGVLATIVATPCTAPFMGVAMGVGRSADVPRSGPHQCRGRPTTAEP